MATRKKRKHPRARAKGLSVLLPSAGGVTPCTVEDVSLGGVFFRTSEQFPVGAQLIVTLVKPGMRKGLKIQSTVVNLRPAGEDRQAGIGVRFDALTEETRDRLGALLTEFGLSNPEEREEDASLDPPDAPPLEAGAAAVASSPSLRGSGGGSSMLGRPFLPSYDGGSVEPEPEDVSEGSLSVELDAAVPKVPPPMLRRRKTAEGLDIAPGVMDRLKTQLQQLLMRLGQAEQRLATKDAELEALRRRITELEKALGQRDLEVAKLRAAIQR